MQGENALQCAIRELREETGIQATSITEIGRVVHDRHQTIYVEFLCVTNCNKASVTLQEGETSAYRWIAWGELCDLSRRQLVTQRILNLIDG